MRPEFINPFLRAAAEVLESELGSPPVRGQIGLQSSPHTSAEVTAIVAVTGDIAGMVLLAMTEVTARSIVSHLMGQDFPDFDTLAQSGIAEIGNVVTGRAAVLLSEAGFHTNLAPPMLIIGRDTTINTLDVQRLVIPLQTSCGQVEIQVALKFADVAARQVA
jgi:chemotaxis protein CheX